MATLTPPPIIITSKSGKPLNDVFNFLLDSGIIEQDIISRVEIDEGETTIGGDGDAPVECIEIHINEKIYSLKNHIELLQKLTEFADIELNDAEVRVFLENTPK